MKDYRGGILVKVLSAGRSDSGRVYSDAVLAGAVRLTESGRPIACHIGHKHASYVGRFIDLEHTPGALWGRLVGANVAELMAMHAGALAAGRPGLGVSIMGQSMMLRESGVITGITSLSSIDIDSRSEAAAAGGLVPFGEDGLPVPWEDRYRHIRVDLVREAQALLARAEQRGGSPRPTEAVTLSLEEVAERVRAMFNPPSGMGGEIAGPDAYFWVRATYADRVILEKGGALFEVPYELTAGGDISFGEPAAVRIVYERVKGALSEAVHRPSGTLTMIHESNCGQLLRLLA